MITQEIRVRQEINKMGYKLKYACDRYYIKGYPNGLAFDTLQQVENWIKEKQVKEKQERIEYQKQLEKINETVAFPICTESCKDVLFKFIRERGIKDDVDTLQNIFDENSELYEDMFSYEIETILQNINYDKRHGNSLYFDLETEMDGYYFNEIKRINSDIDEEIIVDLPDYEPLTFYTEVLEHITPEELKQVVMKIKEDN